MDAILPHATISEGVESNNYDTESARLPSSHLSSVSNQKQKLPSEDDFDLQTKKSLSLRKRKLSFAGFSIGVGFCCLFFFFYLKK